MVKATDDLVGTILARRKYGVTTCCVQPRSLSRQSSPVAAAIDAFVGTLGFKGLGDEWMEVPRIDAVQIVTKVLHKDLAYGVQMVTEEEATILAEKFIALFGEAARFYSNHFGGWPISESTFDAGVVGISNDQLGILWVEDED